MRNICMNTAMQGIWTAIDFCLAELFSLVPEVHNLENASFFIHQLKAKRASFSHNTEKTKALLFYSEVSISKSNKKYPGDGKNYSAIIGVNANLYLNHSFRALIYILQCKLCKQGYSFKKGRPTSSAHQLRVSETRGLVSKFICWFPCHIEWP